MVVLYRADHSDRDIDSGRLGVNGNVIKWHLYEEARYFYMTCLQRQSSTSSTVPSGHALQRYAVPVAACTSWVVSVQFVPLIHGRS